MIYEGQAKLKLYEDIACTREIELDISGKYILSTNCITGEPTHDYEKKIYIKNYNNKKKKLQQKIIKK